MESGLASLDGGFHEKSSKDHHEHVKDWVKVPADVSLDDSCKNIKSK